MKTTILKCAKKKRKNKFGTTANLIVELRDFYIQAMNNKDELTLLLMYICVYVI